MNPVIGITPSAQTDKLDHGTFRRYCLSAPYVLAVEAAGGVPVILPPQQDPSSVVAFLDGIVLSGGPDIDPARYGDSTVHEATYGVDSARDQWEIDLFAAALRREMPVFGICRGIQVINVALSGTLIQDVATEHPGAAAIGHRQHERGLEDSAIGHEVVATEPALLPIFDGNRLDVNSFHHQAIKELAPGLVPVCHSPDRLIEAVAMRDRPVFAVQWHPELMFQRYPAHLRGFSRLVEAATARKISAAIA